MKKKATGLVAAGLVAGLALGSIGVATAATVSDTSASTTSTAQAAAGTFDGHKGGPGKHGDGRGDIAEALAKLSGLTEAEIHARRDAGKSYAAIAASKNLTTDALVAETVKIETAECDAQVKAGTMTEAEKTQVLTGIEARLKTEIASTEIGRGPGGRGHGGPGDATTGSSTTGTGRSARPAQGSSTVQ
jgi:hypothetical protein